MKWYVALIASCGITLLLFGTQLLDSGPRPVGPLTTIHGVPFEQQGTSVLVTEALAHTDIYLHEPVLAKKLILQITFLPGTTRKLSVGVRENSFWLSYQPVVVYDQAKDGAATNTITRTVTIPLTDKIQDQDRSIDLLFFTTDLTNLSTVDQKQADTTQWQLVSLTAQVQPVPPSPTELKDYIRSIIKRERPL